MYNPQMPPRSPSPQHFPLPPSFPPTDTLFYPSSDPNSPLLLFLPGNPGLIAYYTTFLSTLSSLYPSISVLGVSHANFTPSAGKQPVRTLEHQVVTRYELLLHAARHLRASTVLLCAHSMGCWLSLEMLHRFHPAKGSQRHAEEGKNINIIGGIMLFPTVMNIRDSPSGQLLGPFLASPLVRRALCGLSYALSWWPRTAVESLVRLATGQGRDAAETTAVLLRNPPLLQQTLCMAAEEMEQIREDRWGDEVWNCGADLDCDAARGGGMVFVFGQNDHWVAEKTKEEMIEMRGGREKGPKMVVDEEKRLPHGFCIHHGEVVAEMCRAWIEQILGVDR